MLVRVFIISLFLIFAIQAKDAGLVETTEVDGNINTLLLDSVVLTVAQGKIDGVRDLLVTDSRIVNYQEAELGLTPLAIAILANDEEMVQFLLAQDDINVNQVIFDGMTALHSAVLQNNPRLVALLLTCPTIDTAIVDAYGDTAEHLALMNGYKDCLALLQAYK